MGLFDKLKKDKAPETKPAAEKGPAFMDRLSQLQTHMVSVCNDYAKGCADKIFIYGYISEGSIGSNCFYEVNGKMFHKHKMDEATGGKVDVSKERGTEFLRTLNHDMIDFVATLKEADQKIPYEVKLVYDAKKGSLDGHYSYPPIPKKDEDLALYDMFIRWFDEMSSGGVIRSENAGVADSTDPGAITDSGAPLEYGEFEKFVDAALENDLPDGVVAICFNLYDDPGTKWSIEIVGTSAFDSDDSDWACEEATDFNTRSNPLSWREDAEHEAIQKEAIALVKKYLESGNHADKLKAVQGIGVGFVDGDLEVI